MFAERGFEGTTVRQIAGKVGITDAAIYAHFDSKQALFDALMAEGGPPLLDRIGVDLEAMQDQHPAEVIPDVFERLVKAWDQPRVRMFTGVLLRNAPERINTALGDVLARLDPVFEAWMKRGWLRDAASPQLLAWELVAPLATIRLTLLHGRSSKAERRQAHRLARKHLAFYVETHVRAR